MRNIISKFFLTLLVLTMGIGSAWGDQGVDYSCGFESGTDSWGKSSMGNLVSETTNVRTGDKSLKCTCSNANGYARKNVTIHKQSTNYIHFIVWAKSSANTTAKVKIDGTAGSDTSVGTGGWTMIKSSKSITGSGTQGKNFDVLPGMASGSFYLDDAIVYYSTNSATDISYPDGPTAGDPTSNTLNWTNRDDSGDGATGRQATLIWKWRNNGGTGADLTLNNQGIYAVPAEGTTVDQSGYWELVSATVAANATSYTSASDFTPGDKYAIVHRDLAYNYSEPAYVTIPGGGGGGDTEAPTLSSSTPADGATGVAVSGNIVLTMSENVSVANASNFSLTGGDGSLTTASISVSGAAITIPYTGLDNNTEYTFTAAAGAIQDGAATPNTNAAFSFTFTTVAAGPTTPTLTYNDGVYTIGGSDLDLSTLIETKQSNGTITYSVKTDGDTDASIDGVNFSATAAGTATITASQAADGETYLATTAEFDVVVSAAAPCPTSGVIFSADVKVNSNQSFASGSITKISSDQADVTGGEIYAINEQGSAKNLIAPQSSVGYFCHTNNNTYFKIELECALAEGDRMTAKGYGGTKDGDPNNKGIWVSTATSRPSSAPAADGTSATASLLNPILDYTITSTDEYVGKKTIYVYRAAGASTYFDEFTITRPYAISFVSAKGVAPSATTGFEVALTQITGVSGWVHTGWTANKVVKVSGADVAIGTAMAVDATATVSDDTQFTAVWEEEVPTFSVTYKANNGTEEADVEHATESAFAANMFTAPEGKLFNGWNTKAEGDGTPYAVGAAVTAATTVYAQWIVDPTIRLIKTDGSLNTVDFASVGGTLKDDKSYTVNSVVYDKYVLLSGTYTSAIAGNTMQTKYIIYDTQSDATDIKLYLYNTNSSAQNLYYQVFKDGAAVGTKQEVSIASKGDGQVVVIPTIEHSKKTRVVFCVQSTNILFCQIEVLENGTALAGFGENGYQLSIPGRPASTSKLTNIDGFEIKSYNDLKMGSGTDYLALRGVDGSTYVTFTTASNIQLQVTTANANKFYVCAANIGTSSDKQYGGEAGTHNVNLLAGTYYIVPTAGSSGGEVQITKLAFATAPATVTVTFNSNEGSAVAAQELFSGDKAVEPTAPTKSGYRFVEWQLSGSAYDFDATVTANITLDAVWQQVWTVTFNSNGGSDVDAAVVDNGATVAAPDPAPTKGGYDFVEWRKEGESVAYNFATAVTANITLVAQWEVAQDDASLSALSYNGNAIDVNSAVDEAGVQTYHVLLPWMVTPAVNPALFSFTKNAESATPSTPVYNSETKTISFSVTSGNGLVTVNYAIVFAFDEKRGTSIVKAVVSGGNQTAGFDATGIYGDKGYANTLNKKLDTGGKFVGVKLLSGKTFETGDKLYVATTVAADRGYIELYSEAAGTNLIKATGVRDASAGIEIPSELVGLSEFYIVRKTSDGDQSWNGTVNYVEVTRLMSPAIKSFKIGERVATINEGAKTISIEVPYATDVTALTPTVEAYGNNGATYTPDGETNFTNPVDYVVTDAYNELSTTYEVTVTKAPASTNANLASLAVAGYSLDFDPATTSYNIVLDYGTTVLPTITYEVAEVGLATAEKVEGSVNSATTITVTPEAGAGYEKVYTINFSVSTNPKYVIYDGSTMTNIASATGADGSTGFSYSLASNIPLSGDAISSSWGGKDYTHAIKSFKPNDNSSNIVSFVIPEGYVAKVRLVGSTNNDTKERKLFIAMSASKDAADAIDNYIITSSTYDAQGFVTDYLLPNTYYLGSTDSYRLFEFSIQLYPIDYSRNVTEGRFGTICLPNGGVLLGADLYEVAYYGETSKKIFFDEILSGVMEAGVPYVFLPQEGVNKLAVVYTDDADAAATNRNGLVGFIGTNEDAETSVPEGMYILQNNQYREVLAGADARIKSYRAYINLGAITPTAPALAPGRRRISMSVMSENAATGIDGLDAAETPVKMMIDGQLYILRGEKMYDATGRLVK